jgi:hypothetical protein
MVIRAYQSILIDWVFQRSGLYLWNIVFQEWFKTLSINLNKKFLLVLCNPMRWDLPCNKKINNVSKPRQIRNIKELLIRESVLDRHCLRGIFDYKSRQVVSYYIFYSLLIFMERLNSWSRRIHLINLAFASFLVRRYFKAAWSVKATIGDPTK